MDIPAPSEGDVNIGNGIFAACWVLTAIVAMVMIFRMTVKAWIAWILPKVSSSERIWGLEDFLFIWAFLCDIAHMALIWESHEWGLGRHFYYLTPLERNRAMKWDFASQPLAVSSSMISRTGMMWFLYQCFAVNNRRLRPILIGCMAVQILVNLFTIIQIVVQCGPNPYMASNRTLYFHYMWDPLPEDGSVICQAPTVQATIGFVQGAFNTLIDFGLAYVSAVELWQHLFKTMHRENVSFMTQYRKLDKGVKSRRIWQTIILSGPLVLSGVASIVKTVLLKSLGDRLDFTYNIVTFILWVKIENYSILVASCAPIARTFTRTFIDQRREAGQYGSRSSTNHAIELGRSNKTKSVSMNGGAGFRRMGSEDELFGVNPGGYPVDGKSLSIGDKTGGVMIETDITVQVEDGELPHQRGSKDIEALANGQTATAVSAPTMRH